MFSISKQNKEFLSVFLLIFILFTSCQRHAEKGLNETRIQPTDNTISLSAAQIQLANIKVAQVYEGEFNYNHLFPGVLKVNEESVSIISSRATGRILKLFLKNTGEIVNKGDSIYQIYCEDLVTAERQYFTLQSNNWNYNGKYEPSLALENKLLLLGMLPPQIDRLKKNGKILFAVTIFSPVKGIVRTINISEGQYVTAGQTLFELADDRKLWLEAQVHPEDLEYLKVGMPSDIVLPDAENRTLKSTISFINPTIEQGKNVTIIRSVIDNSTLKLHPGMLAIIHVQAGINKCVLAPVSSLITDKNGSVVWVRNENGTFTGRKITVGLQSENTVQVLSGLKESESVVISGAYLLNSELILRKGTISEGHINM
jgi:membrane fusion protein, copper/silver efflux system